MLVPYAEFGSLRLAHFVDLDRLVDLEGWEYLDHIWVGEAVGFSEWLRLASAPEVLGSLAVDLVELPPSAVGQILGKLRLPLRAGMTIHEVSAVLGEPRASLMFTPDRETFEYLVGAEDRYTLSCTINHEGGLVYLTVLSHEHIEPPRESRRLVGVSHAAMASSRVC